MSRIAMIGAGSLVFAKTLMADMLATEALAGSEFALMATTHTRLDRMQAFVQRMIDHNGLKATVRSTTSRREALQDADYVISMIKVGGNEAFGFDYNIPMKYGVDQCIGDTMGPGGIFRALRHIPMLMDLAYDMRELCPRATLLNYANPMAMCCWALGQVPGLRFVGLCHGVQTTLDLIARYCGVKKEEIDFLNAGINHMDWFLKLKHRGRDLYPLLREKFELPEYYINEKVRGEVFRHFGYFMTESSGHLSEYLPYFRKNRKALDTYCDQPGFGGESGAAYRNGLKTAEKFAQFDPLSIETTELSERSAEYCSHIIEALETGVPFRFSGNVRNDNYITNLPNGACVEVPVYADRMGLHPTTIGELPPQLAALCMSNVQCQGVATEAAIQGDPELLMQAVALDPLTSAVLTLEEIRRMVGEMLEAERPWLPQFEGATLRPIPMISIPEGTKGVDVPLDPALAIANRFIKLAKAKAPEKE